MEIDSCHTYNNLKIMFDTITTTDLFAIGNTKNDDYATNEDVELYRKFMFNNNASCEQIKFLVFKIRVSSQLSHFYKEINRLHGKIVCAANKYGTLELFDLKNKSKQFLESVSSPKKIKL